MEIKDNIILTDQKMVAIIPCCGYGTRMGMKPNESKELLPGPDGIPLIQWHIDLCKEYNLEPVFIIRPEKTDLIEYVKDEGTIVLYSPKDGEEWMWTIYNNREHYGQKNILLLPDTRFEPREKIKDLKEYLEWLEIVSLTHHVGEPAKWGIISEDYIYEKPESNGWNLAWGVLGFDISVINIFEELGKNKYADISKLVKYKIPLDKFEDLTRGK